jgi:hypothetical protein
VFSEEIPIEEARIKEARMRASPVLSVKATFVERQRATELAEGFPVKEASAEPPMM